MGEGEEGAGSRVISFNIEISSRARRNLKKIPRQDLLKVVGALEILRTNPTPPAARKLRGSSNYRVRIGNYRIMYTIKRNHLIILVVDVEIGRAHV